MTHEKPVIKVWDIETGYNLTYTFNGGKQFIPHTSIIQERYIICATFKQLGHDQIDSVSLLDDLDRFCADPCDDEYVVKEIHKMLSECDGVIAHYGDAFDIKFFNSRALYYGLPPLKPLIQIDTYKMARQQFFLNSYKLDYLANFLGIGQKMKTDHSLWSDCFKGKASAVQYMLDYNIMDVEILEEVYNRISPFCRTKLNMNLFSDELVCPKCSSENVSKRGPWPVQVYIYQGYGCKDCGHRFRGSKSIGSGAAG